MLAVVKRLRLSITVAKTLNMVTIVENLTFRTFDIKFPWFKRAFFTTMGSDFEHMIKARAHKGGVRLGKTPKKLASICCP
jgi:hypothetical protein